jgi:hypothetical protein
VKIESTGPVKELLLDDYPSGYDLTANIAGAIAGVYLNRLINKWETKHFIKQKKKI